MKEIELIDKRKLNEKHFLQEDGTIIAKVYNTNVHYIKNGKYEEIDNSLVKENDCYVNKSNDYKVSFKEQGKDSLIKMEKEDNYLDIKLKQSNLSNMKKMKKVSKLVETVSYNNILNDIDIQYNALPNKVKETIVLNNNNVDDLNFIVDTNLTLELINGIIIAKNGDESIFKIEKPYMEDSNGVINENIFYKIVDNDGLYEIQLVLDTEWLNSEERKYPVYIDPTITDDKLNTIMDTYIYPGDTNEVRYNQPILKAGVEKNDNKDIINRTLIKFNLPTIGTGSEVVSANLSLCGYVSNNAIVNKWSKPITIHRVTKDWTEESANWENMHDQYDERVDGVEFVNRSHIENDVIVPQYSDSIYGDITDLVKHWYRDTPNYGILIKSAEEVYIDDDYPAFYSKNHTFQNADPQPVLTISYRNHNGLEDYLDYQSQSFTDGTTYVNTYNGNLVGVFQLGKTIGSKLPVSLSLIYNTNDVILKKNGFRFNLEQTLKEISINNEKYYEYNDSDGTIHYFKNQKFRVLKPGIAAPPIDDLDNENYYEVREYCADEDGLMLKLEQENDNFVIKDKNNSKILFSKNNSNDNIYYLKEIIDVSNNKVTLYYNQNNKISKIIDSSNDEINIDYGTANLIKIVSPIHETTINFDENNKVSLIATNNGTTNFTYNSKNLISSITNVNGLKCTYEYYDENPYRIKKVSSYGLNNTLGTTLTFQYGFNETSIIDNKNRMKTILFNSNGNKISSNTIDSNNNISEAYSICNSVSENNSDRYYEKNKLLYSGTLVKYVKNYLKNSSFETNENIFNTMWDNGIEKSFSTDCSVTGDRSLKIVTTGNNITIETDEIQLKTGKYYTFSGYFKNDQKVKIALKGTDFLPYPQNNVIEVKTEEEIDTSTNFTRHDVTFYHKGGYTDKVKVCITFEGAGTYYIDDIQLEEGQVANNYNMLENSDFSDGLNNWILTPIDSSKDNTYEIVNLNDNNNSALKINLSNSKSVSSKIPIQGKSGDIFDVSFWLKNEGILATGGAVVNCIEISFEPVDENIDQYLITSNQFIPNKKWQFIEYKCQAYYDYKSVSINFLQENEYNQMYISNISFHKQQDTNYYHYDTYGNLVKVENINNNINTFAYDKNNQLISSTTPMGGNFKYEYDNLKTDRVLNAISSMGISNQVKYDNYGNPILTRISKKVVSHPDYKNRLWLSPDSDFSISPGIYKIRSKGTEKYFKAEYTSIFLEEDSCSNTLWELKKIGDNYKIIYSISPNYSLEYLNGMLILNTNDANNLFTLEENSNGSYHIKLASENKYIKSNNASIEISDLITDDPTFEFYFERNETKFIENSATYTENGKYIESVTDSLFNKTLYQIDNTTGLTTSITNAKNQITNYTYNDKEQLISIEQNNKLITYSYNKQDLLDEINPGNASYKFEYDEFLNNSKVMIGKNIILITNIFEENNGNLKKAIYGNNHEISYEYDEFDRVKIIHKMDNDYDYHYNSSGKLAKIIVNSLVSTYDSDGTLLNLYDGIIKYTYDNIDRIKEYQTDDFKINYEYNSNNFIIRKLFMLDNLVYHLENYYNSDDILIQSRLDDQEINYEYDEIGRLKSKNINNHYYIGYDYVSNGNRTSTLIGNVINGTNKHSYLYDALNNITHIYYNDELIKEYYYDDNNELIEENNYQTDQKIVYNYDNFGNLLEKQIKNLETNDTIKTDVYQYSNSNWQDQLSKFNESNITYDEIGNPITIGDDISLNWINGRCLYSYDDISKNLEVKYQYDVDSIRTSKVVNGVETKYYLEDSNIIFEKCRDNVIYYLYDESGLIGLKYNDNIYYYIKDLQGDIIGILDSSYKQIVSYEYDSWGKVLSIKDENGNEIVDESNVGIVNPFRYREYYYDNETGLYYLNSRYYNPIWGRFLNADGIIGANQDAIGYNLYAYCSNNPINHCDLTGMWSFSFKTVLQAITHLIDPLGSTRKIKKNRRQLKKEKKAYEVVKKVTKTVAKGAVDNFVFEIGFGEGADLEIGKHTKVGISQDVTYTYKNGKISSNIIQNYSISVAHIGVSGSKIREYPIAEKSCGYGFSPTDSYVMKCPEAHDIGNSVDSKYGSLANDSIFLGISDGLHVVLGYHIKIGWEIPQ